MPLGPADEPALGRHEAVEAGVGLLEKASAARQGGELLGQGLAGQGPEPRARAARQYQSIPHTASNLIIISPR